MNGRRLEEEQKETNHDNISKLVCACNGIIVEHNGANDPPRNGVVGKHAQLVLGALVADKVETLLNVAGHNAIVYGIQGDDGVGKGLGNVEEVWMKSNKNELFQKWNK